MRHLGPDSEDGHSDRFLISGVNKITGGKKHDFERKETGNYG